MGGMSNQIMMSNIKLVSVLPEKSVNELVTLGKCEHSFLELEAASSK
jgi:hypothetical protein